MNEDGDFSERLVFEATNRNRMEKDALSNTPKRLMEELFHRADCADRFIGVALSEFSGSKAMTADAVSEVAGWAGRVYGPRVLYMLDRLEAMRPDAYTVVPDIWSGAEFPGQALSRSDWRRLWAKCGFVIDDEPAERPAEPIAVWRAARPKAKGGMSWTDDESVARWFLDARSRSRSGDIHLYRAEVPPGKLLARIHESGRRESEWVVDTRGVNIEQIE